MSTTQAKKMLSAVVAARRAGAACHHDLASICMAGFLFDNDESINIMLVINMNITKE